MSTPASACPPSGNLTAAPGSAGPTRKRPGPASSARCRRSSPGWCACSPSRRRCTSTSPDRRWRPTCAACWRTRARTRATSSSTTIPRTTPGAGITARSSSTARRAGKTEEAILDWGYNAWGGKYPPYDLDDVIPTRIGREYGLPVVSPGMILEGGSIDVNGRGSLLTTEACLLNPNRNPKLDRDAIEAGLRRYLGVSNILWLGDGIAGDDTDGHVDDLTRFVDSDHRRHRGGGRPGRRKLRAAPGKPGAAPHDARSGRDARFALSPCRCRARSTTRASGSRPATRTSTSRTAWSCSRPTTPSATAKPRAILKGVFPDRDVVGIDCTDLVWGLGAFHCVTQQWPSQTGRSAVGQAVSNCPLPVRPTARLSQLLPQVPTSAARRPPHESIPTPAIRSSLSVRLTT